MADEPDTEVEETEEEPDNWARLEEIVERKLKEGLSGWAPPAAPSASQNSPQPEKTPSPKRNEKKKRPGMFSDWF